MAVGQFWRAKPDNTAAICPGRPDRPVPIPGTSRYQLVTRIRATSTYLPPPAFVIGTTVPDASNTGATGNLVRYPASGDGDLYVTTAGAVIENRDVYGHIFVQAPDVTIRNCRVRGRSSAGFVTYGLVNCQDSRATNCLVELCTLAPTFPQWWTVGVKGNYNFTVRRCNIYDVVDGIDAYEVTTQLTAEGNYIHDLSFFDNSNDHATDSAHPYWTHNDCIQLSGGTGHTIRGNTLLGWASATAGMPGTLTANGYPQREICAGITASPDKGAITGLLITKNFGDGGVVFFQSNALPASGSTAMGEISYNTVGMGQHDFGNGSRYQIRFKSGYTITGLATNAFGAYPTVPSNLQGVTFTTGFTGGVRIDN